MMCLMLTNLNLAWLLQSHRTGRERTLCLEGRYLAARGESLVLEPFDQPRLYVFWVLLYESWVETKIISTKMSISPFL